MCIRDSYVEEDAVEEDNIELLDEADSIFEDIIDDEEDTLMKDSDLAEDNLLEDQDLNN